MGGNIFIQSKCNMSIYGNAIISGGKTNADGGNIALNSGTLTVKGNVQIKDGRATRYEINEYVDDKGKTKQEEAFVADGGNIYCYGSRENVYVTEIVDGVETQVKKTVYYNELTIQDNVVISGGWAVRGGNIAAEDTTVNIGSGVTIKDGLAGILVGDEMTYDAGIGTASRGGNIYHNTTNCPVNIAATLSGGVALHGGNLSQYSGTITFSGIMENGYAYGNGGNAVARSGVLNLEGAELRNAISVGQGGNLRAYEVEINMNGGKIYGGDDLSANNSDNVWLVASTLNMSGDATVIGGTEKASGVRMVPYNNKISVLTLADNATVVGTDGAPNVVTIQENDAGKAIVYIEEGWAGTAQVATTQAYTYGDTISNESLVVGNFAEDGTFVKGGTYSGQLYRDVVPVYGVEGDVVMPNAAIVAEDGTETIYRTNAEALAAYTYDENGYVILGGAIAEIPETIAELNVDIAGHEVTFSGNAKVNAIDSANNSFVKNGKLIIAEGSEITVETVIERNDKRYIALQDEEGAWSFHRVIVRLNTVTLRTEGAGIYYKAVYYCDETLRDLVDSYGVALSVTDMPGADFETADKYTAYTGEDFAAAYEENRVYTISGAVTGIWKERNTCERNDANADVKIYANPYLKLNIGAEGMLIMADGEDAYSLNDTLAGVNENWAGYEAEEQSAVTSFLDNWFMFLTEETAEQLQATLTNIFPAA